MYGNNEKQGFTGKAMPPRPRGHHTLGYTNIIMFEICHLHIINLVYLQ